MGFEDHASDDKKIYVRAFSSGSKPSSNLTTVENVTTLPIYNTDGTIESKSGTVVVGKGAESFGTFPSSSATFNNGTPNIFLWNRTSILVHYSRRLINRKLVDLGNTT